MNIVCVHLLNDRSGSPRVLKNTLEAFESGGHDVTLFVGSTGDGILSETSVPIERYFYKRFENKFLTLISYCMSQLSLLVLLFLSHKARKADVIFINTVLPFGAAVFGKITRKKVIYHIHEISISPKPLSWFLKKIVSLTASRAIFVSNIHRKIFEVSVKTKVVVYNGYDSNFDQYLSAKYSNLKNSKFRVLMLASLREYKGIYVFLELAKRLARNRLFEFELVLNDIDAEVELFKAEFERENLHIALPVDDPSDFYRNASILVNLSLPDQWVETFGLTIVEAMVFGLPVIVPPVGGPSEIVEDGKQGYLIDSRDIEKLLSTIQKLSEDNFLISDLSEASRERARSFSSDKFQKSILGILDNI